MLNGKITKRNAQASIEYAIFIAMAILCFAALFLFRNQVAGKFRTNMDAIGSGEQYDAVWQ